MNAAAVYGRNGGRMDTTDEIRENITSYLQSHKKMTLATVSANGRPMAHTVEYASEGVTVYFATNRSSRKVQNIRKNPHVAYTVDEDYEDWFTIKGVQVEGVATVLAERTEIGKAARLYIEKFPFIVSFPQSFEIVFVKIEPVSGFYLDYSKGFAHKERVEL